MSIKIREKDLYKMIDKSIKSKLNEITNSENAFKISDYFNLDEIPFKKLEEQYVDLSFYLRGSGYGNKLLWDKKRIIAESAYKTSSINEVQNEFKRIFDFKDWQFKIDSVANKVKIIILFVNYGTNSRIVIEEMKALGWTFSYSDFANKNGIPLIAISFGPKYQKSVSKEARGFQYLFHWSPKYNLESILKNGLIPQCKNSFFDYPPHVHLMKGNISEENKILLGYQLFLKNNDSLNNGEYVLFAINTSKIPQKAGIYLDPRYEWEYYTKRRIPLDAIIPIGEIKFKKANKNLRNYQIIKLYIISKQFLLFIKMMMFSFTEQG